jgi:ABC-type polysaccharide/polyol phosphate transport system ATPase subunit
MNSDRAIEVSGVSKSFTRKTGQMLLRSHVARWFQRNRTEPFFALKNVSFSVAKGESVAVVGQNGAGKSTLLGLIVGLTQPDSGEIRVCGRVAPLLEIGSGFHPDLTGIENLRLNASLLGLTRKRTEELYETIVEFSGIGDFIREPLRTYSAGMVMRLAFSVAVHTDPDILVIDEVLAVGDQSFQTKCFEKLLDFKRSGKTIFCVSHSLEMLEWLCERAIWLDHGEVIMDDSMRSVREAYEGRMNVQKSI